MKALAEHCAAIAADLRAKSDPPREWFHVKHAADEFDLFLCPPQSSAWVRARYPGAGVEGM